MSGPGSSPSTLPGISIPSQPPPQPPPEVEAAPADARLGRYVKIRKLGMGGMSSVWKAWDSTLGRWVALKMLSVPEGEGSAWLEREARLAGRLMHPNIAAIHEVGEDGGRHFIAMQLIEGRTLSEMKGENRRTLMTLVRDAARGVAHAHQQGVVHRDIKPDNLMVTSRAKEGPGGRAEWEHHLYVTDFGLARPAAGRSDLTSAGIAVGTPQYMAPEQGRCETVDARADVYAFGATMYELIAGRPPIVGADAEETIRLIQKNDPVPLRAIDAGIDERLETIVHKCLEKDPSRRYEHAGELADDLERWLGGQEIEARPPGVLSRFGRRAERHRAITIAVSVALLMIGLFLAIAIPVYDRMRAGRERAERALRLTAPVSAALSEAEMHLRQGEPLKARQRLEEAVGYCRAELSRGELPEAHAWLGRLLRAKGDHAEALRELDRALAGDPNLKDARLDRGLLRRARLDNRLSGCAVAMADAREEALMAVLDPQTIEKECEWLAKLRAGADEDMAASAGGTTFARDADRGFAQAELARARGDVRGAREGFERLLAADPKHVAALVSLASMAEAEGKLADAEALCAQAIERHPTAGEPWLRRAFVRLRRASHERNDSAARTLWRGAVEDASKAIELGVDSPEAWWAKGLAERHVGRPMDAMEDFGRSVSRDPEFIEGWIGRAWAQMEMGDMEGMMRDLATAKKLSRVPWMRVVEKAVPRHR